MFMFNYGYADSRAMVIALSIILGIEIIGLCYIIYNILKKS